MNDGGSIFPTQTQEFLDDPGSFFRVATTLWKGGMSLRDYFASTATEEDIYPYMNFPHRGSIEITREAAKFRYADAMLEARKTQ
jgi:hypothetical protein